VVEAIQAKAAPPAVAPIAPILPTRHSATGGARGQTLETIGAVEAAELVQATTTTPAVAPIATIPPPSARLPECLFVDAMVHREQIAMVAPGVAEGQHLVRDCLPIFARGAKIADRGANGVPRRLGKLRHNEERSSRWHWGACLFALHVNANNSMTGNELRPSENPDMALCCSIGPCIRPMKHHHRRTAPDLQSVAQCRAVSGGERGELQVYCSPSSHERLVGEGGPKRGSRETPTPTLSLLTSIPKPKCRIQSSPTRDMVSEVPRASLSAMS